MEEHILITYAKRKKNKEVRELPEGAVFDHIQGFWKKK